MYNRFTTCPAIGTRVFFTQNGDPSDKGTVVGHDGRIGVWVRWDNGDYDIPETAPDGDTAELFAYRDLSPDTMETWIR